MLDSSVQSLARMALENPRSAAIHVMPLPDTFGVLGVCMTTMAGAPLVSTAFTIHPSMIVESGPDSFPELQRAVFGRCLYALSLNDVLYELSEELYRRFGIQSLRPLEAVAWVNVTSLYSAHMTSGGIAAMLNRFEPDVLGPPESPLDGCLQTIHALKIMAQD